MINPLNEWWIVGAFALVTLIIATLAYLLRQGEAPAVLHGNGEHDDAPGLRAWLRGDPVRWAGGAPVERRLHGCIFRVDSGWMVADVDSPRWLLDCTFVYPDGRDVVTREM